LAAAVVARVVRQRQRVTVERVVVVVVALVLFVRSFQHHFYLMFYGCRLARAVRL
jgi:hypothetical protein